MSSTSTLHLLTIALSREDEDIMLGAGVDWLLLSPASFKNSWLKLDTISKILRTESNSAMIRDLTLSQSLIGNSLLQAQDDL